MNENDEETQHERTRQEDASTDNPSEMTANDLLKERVQKLLSTLPEREREILTLRFERGDGVPRTLEEIGKKFTVTRERIRQIEAKALRKGASKKKEGGGKIVLSAFSKNACRVIIRKNANKKRSNPMSDNEKRIQKENGSDENKEKFFRWMDLHVASSADYRKRMCKALESELDAKLPGLGIGNLFRIVSPEDLCAIIDKIKGHHDWPFVNKSIRSGAANAALNHYKSYVGEPEQGAGGDLPAAPVTMSHKPRQAQRRVGVQRINGFKYPSADKIDGRTSTICRSMACTLLERKACRPEDERTWQGFFPEKKCAYCGKPASHLDHLHALIVDRKPTGYGTEPANLVPCCRECNQPKGNMEWEEFMRSDKCRHVGGSQTDNPKEAMEKRIKTIQAFQAAMPPKKVVFDGATIGKWTEILGGLDAKLKEAHDALLGMKKTIYGDEGE